MRSCQALSAVDLALTALSPAESLPEAGGGAAVDGGGGITGSTGGATGSGGGGGASGILSGGAEGDMTAALRKLHELGPSLAGRCVCIVMCVCVCVCVCECVCVCDPSRPDTGNTRGIKCRGERET